VPTRNLELSVQAAATGTSNLLAYGADATGTNFSDAAMTAAIAACGATGGTIRIPRGIYKFANPWNLTNLRSIYIEGDGGDTNNASAGTQIQYTGSTSGFIQMISAFGCSIRKMSFVPTNTAFTGWWLLNYGDGTHGDSYANTVEDCYFNCNPGGQNVYNAGFLLANSVAGQNSQLFYARRTYMQFGQPCVYGIPTGVNSFAVGAIFDGCEFIHAPGSYAFGNLGMSWQIRGCVFEPPLGAYTPSGALNAININTGVGFNAVVGTTIQGNWFGDGTATSQVMSLSGTGFSITGNFINGDTAAGNSIGIFLTSARGVDIRGNYFSNQNYSLGFGDANCQGITFQGNYLTSVSTPIGQYNSNAPYDMVYGPNYPRTVPPSGATYAPTGAIGPQSATAVAVATSGTIATVGLGVSRVAPAGAVTGVILQAGTYQGQPCVVINESAAASTVTMAVAGTSNVADGASCVIAGLTQKTFIWDTGTSLWYHS
jgi:hypothetical protein